MEADVLHRRSNDRFVGPRQHVTAVAVHNRGAGTVGPGERGHLALYRSYGDRPRNSLDLASPSSGREDDIARAVSSILANDADGTITSQIDADRGVRHDPCSGPFGVGQQRSNQALRLDGPFVRGPERARASAKPGPPGAHFVGIEPIREVTLLPLPGHPRAQVPGFGLVGGHPGDSFSPKTDVDSGPLQECRSKRRVELTPGKAELEDWVLRVGLDLGGQHARGSLPGLTAVSTLLHHNDAAAAERQFPGAGRPDGATTYNRNIGRSSHLYFDETI